MYDPVLFQSWWWRKVFSWWFWLSLDSMHTNWILNLLISSLKMLKPKDNLGHLLKNLYFSYLKYFLSKTAKTFLLDAILHWWILLQMNIICFGNVELLFFLTFYRFQKLTCLLYQNLISQICSNEESFLSINSACYKNAFKIFSGATSICNIRCFIWSC